MDIFVGKTGKVRKMVGWKCNAVEQSSTEEYISFTEFRVRNSPEFGSHHFADLVAFPLSNSVSLHPHTQTHPHTSFGLSVFPTNCSIVHSSLLIAPIYPYICPLWKEIKLMK